MNHLLDDQEDNQPRSGQDREITLGTATVLGIFFGLAILCAAFFGFGYSLGSKHNAPSGIANGEELPTRTFSGSKPAPGSPAGSNPYAPVVASGQIPSGTAVSSPAPSSTVAPRTLITPAGAADPPSAPGSEELAVKPARTPPPAAVVPAGAISAPLPAQQLVVQVAALSHQEDAELIRTTLERRGYTVAIRPDPQDKLLHVQIGPFSNRKDAEAMRQKLLADGFNAYIK